MNTLNLLSKKYRAVQVEPTTTLRLEGCVVIEGGRFKVKVAELLVLLPAELVTFTVNVLPLSVATVAGVVYEAEVAPLMVVPLFDH